MRNKIVVIGSLNYDIILRLPRLPKCGETFPAEGAGFQAGGKGANQAVQAAKLGLETYMVGCVGNDSMGDYLLETATGYGVNTQYVRRTEEASGMGIVNAMADGEVFACIVRGANYEVNTDDIDQAMPLLKEAEIVILQLEIPLHVAAYGMKKAKECGCKVLLNAAPAAELEENVLSMCDLLVVNEVEASFYLGKTLETVEDAKASIQVLTDRYSCQCIITMGAQGAVVCDGKSIRFIPAHKVDAVETTGAGDSFVGGVAYGLKKGMPLFEACEFATKCSAATVCGVGAQSSMPNIGEVEKN